MGQLVMFSSCGSVDFTVLTNELTQLKVRPVDGERVLSSAVPFVIHHTKNLGIH